MFKSKIRFNYLIKWLNSHRLPLAASNAVAIRRFSIYPLRKTTEYTRLLPFRPLSIDSSRSNGTLSALDFEFISAETLEALSDYFDVLFDMTNSNQFDSADVIYKDGVLTISLGEKYGTYVINKQTPNKQIWLSSPLSGPKRFDFVLPSSKESDKRHGYWIYKHSGVTLHELLDNEISEILQVKAEFQNLPFGVKS